MLERGQLGGTPYSATSIKLASVFRSKKTGSIEIKEFQCPSRFTKKMLEKLLLSDSSVVLGSAGETDEVVTIDTRRQIRCPTSSR